MAGEDQGQGDSRQDRPAPGRTPRSSAERQADFEDLADSGGWTLIGPADETPAQPIVSEPQPTAPVPIPEPPAAPVLQVAPALPEPSVVLPEPVPEVESLAPPAATEFPDPPASAARAPSRAPVPELVVPKRNTFKLPPPLPLSPPPRKRVTLARSAPPP